jgi:hypothetical protein
MSLKKFINLSFLLLFLPFLIISCGLGVDTRKYPANPKEKVKKNMEEGRGFSLWMQLKKEEDLQIMSLQAAMSYGGHLLIL